VPDLAPDELHKDPVVRLGVAAHAGQLRQILGESHPQCWRSYNAYYAETITAGCWIARAWLVRHLVPANVLEAPPTVM
jgi:hypothetical protein